MSLSVPPAYLQKKSHYTHVRRDQTNTMKNEKVQVVSEQTPTGIVVAREAEPDGHANAMSSNGRTASPRGENCGLAGS